MYGYSFFVILHAGSVSKGKNAVSHSPEKQAGNIKHDNWWLITFYKKKRQEDKTLYKD